MSNRQDRPLAKKLLHALGLLALALFLLYVAVQFVLIFHRSYKTETAIRYTLAESLNLTGVVAFDAVDVPGSGNLGYLVQDGERVTNGTVVAECYTDDTQGLQRERLDRLERSITLLTKSQNSAGSELSVLTNQTKQALYNLLDKLDTAQYTGISDAQDSFLLAQNRLQISTGQTADFSQSIAALQTEYDGIKAQLDTLQTVTATTNGYFSRTEASPDIRTDCRALAVETAMQLTEDGSDEKWLELYDELSPELQAYGRLRLLRAVALLHLGRLEEAAEILNRAFVMPDVKEGELSVSYLRLYAKEQGVPYDPEDEALLRAADEKYPLPKTLDFRMH